MSITRNVDIVIAGAGLSGLMSAMHLLTKQGSDQKLTIAVIEARDRVGGRTLTAQVSLPLDLNPLLPLSSAVAAAYVRPYGTVDYGAQWVGPLHKTMIQLVKLFDLELVEQYYPPNEVANSNRLTECVGYKCTMLQTVDAVAVEEYMRQIEVLSDSIDLHAPWLSPMASEHDHMSVQDHVCEHITSSREAQTEVLLFVQTVLAFPPDQISFLFFLFYVKSGGGMVALGDGELGAQKWKVKGGAQQISDKLVHFLSQKGVEFHMSCAVDQVTVNSDNNVAIKTSSGLCVTAKRVIFAISPQLVANISFEPALPAEKLALCRSVLAGHAVKVYLVYSDPFWLDAQESMVCSSTHFTTLGFVHNLFHSSFSCEGVEYPALVGLITGAAALEFEQLPEYERKTSVLRQICQMYGSESKSLHPLYYGDKIWAEEKFSGGCFAGISPPDGTFVNYGVFMRPAIGPLHWASTETAAEFYGYMEGALLAGRRVAEEVLHVFNVLNEPHNVVERK